MRLAQEAYSPAYDRVIMKLGDILDGDFFTQYIKVGSILMLSEGNTSQENVFSLKDGKPFSLPGFCKLGDGSPPRRLAYNAS